VVYLDTGCLVKLYYPEPESAAVAAAVVGERIAFTALHELEIVTALKLKAFRGEAEPEQVAAAIGLVEEDLGGGKLVESPVNWRSVFRGGYSSRTSSCRGYWLSLLGYAPLRLRECGQPKLIFVLQTNGSFS
jgi:hypothetical protein